MWLCSLLCPNVENFCPNNGQFFSVGDATASPAVCLCSAPWMQESVPIKRSGTIRWGNMEFEGAYQDFWESLLFAAKQCITRGRRKNYVPCWDKECETLYHSFTRAPVGTDSDRAASSLLSWLGQKKQERWWEAVNSTCRTLVARRGEQTYWQV